MSVVKLPSHGHNHGQYHPKPFIKWAGGKTQLIPELSKFFLKSISDSFHQRYLEPFVGSGSILFWLIRSQLIQKSIISDVNESLMDTYRSIQDPESFKKLLRLLKKHQKLHSKEYYYHIRAKKFDVNDNRHEKAARMIYLNRTCFNGLWRVNSHGQFNVPMGKYDDPQIINEENLNQVHLALQNVEIRTQHFSQLFAEVTSKDFLYLDPPYHPISETSSFTSYAQGGFKAKDQELLASELIRLSELGVFWILSNSNCEFIKALYKNFSCYEVYARRNINSDAMKRGKITELIIMSEAVADAMKQQRDPSAVAV